MKTVLYSIFFVFILIVTLSLIKYNSIRIKKYVKISNNVPEWSTFKHLIVVPGHAIQWCLEDNQSILDPGCWSLYEYQKRNIPSFLSHIREGLKALLFDDEAILIFSGGQSRASAGPRSEADSYYQLARHLIRTNNVFNEGYNSDKISNVLNRIVTEEYARDSLENLVFSICRFRMLTGNNPQKIFFYGYTSKEKRFKDLHIKAINFSPSNFYYYSGSNLSIFEFSDSAYDLFSKDLTGCNTVELVEKRTVRNPFHQNPEDVYNKCPEFNLISCSRLNN